MKDSAWDKIVERAGDPVKRKQHWSWDETKHRESVRENRKKWQKPRKSKTPEASPEEVEALREKYKSLGIDLDKLIG